MTEARDPGALEGVRVVDFTTGPAGGFATTVLADFGAQVVKVEPPGGDRFRSLASSSIWLRGKHRVRLDLGDATELQQAIDLALDADVVVVGGPPGRVRAWGLDADRLCAAAPPLVHASITGFGAVGPHAGLPAYESLVAAHMGRMAAFEGQLGQGRPVYSAVQVGTHVAAQTTVAGICAALTQRERTGVGGRVETSLLQALSAFDLVDGLAVQRSEALDEPYQTLRSLMPMPTLNYHPVRTSDGVWIQNGNLLEHLFISFLDAVDLLGEFLGDERFGPSPGEWSPEAIEIARDRILERVLEKPVGEWMEIFKTNGNVAAEVIVPTQRAMAHPDLSETGALCWVNDPDRGWTKQIGTVAEFSVGAGVPSDEISEPVTVDQLAPRPEPRESPGSVREPVASRPLDGVTILDLSTIIAAPFGISMLADLGARVIKVEPLSGDPFRQLLTEGRMASRMNQSKESICIDLKTPDGRQLLHELVPRADAIVHNFRGPVPARLGIDWEMLSGLNPRIVSVVVNGYGPDGPSALRPATHPVIGACTGGVAWQAGDALTRDCADLDEVRETARQLMAANEANPDPNTSVVAAASLSMALFAARRTGVGRQVRISMQVANAWANGDDFVSWTGKPQRPPVDADHLGLSERWRLYETADGWVFVAAFGDDEWARVLAMVDSDEAGLASAFRSRTADDWQARARAEGLPVCRADGTDVGTWVTTGPQVVANGWAPVVQHARYGPVRRWPQIVTVDGVNPELRHSPLAGEHTDAILAELGRTPSEIGDLRRRSIVASEPVEQPTT